MKHSGNLIFFQAKGKFSSRNFPLLEDLSVRVDKGEEEGGK